MESLIAYSIPFSGLKDDLHLFDYQIDSSFFAHFPETPITDGQFKVHIEFDKKPNVIDILIDFQGTTNMPCDRCLEMMPLPIKGQNRLLMKYSDSFREEAEIVYIPYDLETINIAKYIYEFLCLAIPLIKTHDLVPDLECDETMRSYLEDQEDSTSAPEGNPLWEQLKNIKLN